MDASPMVSRESTDHFATTAVTWLEQRLEEGSSGRLAANEHVMRVYADPLRVYVQGSSFRKLGEPEDLVQGFFADRLGREDFLAKWRASGRPLRFWLIVGLKHFLLETARRERRHSAQELAEYDQASSSTSDADVRFERSWAQAAVGEALRRADEACMQAGLEEHWKVFHAHHMQGMDYSEIERRFDVPRARAAVMVRTATRHFKKALRDVVGWPSATDEQLDQEIRQLMEASAS